MTENLYSTEGHPFAGFEKERLISFLKGRGLDYDPAITDTVAIVDENTNEVVATGSMSGIILKCVAVSESYHGQGLLSEIMSWQYETLGARGITHFIGFTKPQNVGVFSHMGLHEVVRTEHIIFLENREGAFRKWLRSLQQDRDERLQKVWAEQESQLPETDREKTACQKKIAEEILQEVWEASADLGKPETTRLGGYLIRAEQIPTYFIKDKEHAEEYCRELERCLKDTVRDALMSNSV